MKTTTYRTYVESKLHYTGDNLESALRAWNKATFNLGRSVAGGVSVATYEDHPGTSGLLQTRDGWILHVREDGTCYINPNLTESKS